MQRIQTELENLKQKRIIGGFTAEREEITDWLGSNDAEGGGMLFWSFVIELPGHLDEVTLVCHKGRTGPQVFNVYSDSEDAMERVNLAREVHRDQRIDENPVAGMFEEFEDLLDEVKRSHGPAAAKIVRIAYHASKATEIVGMVMSQSDIPEAVKTTLGKAFARMVSSMIDDSVRIAGLDEGGDTPPSLFALITKSVERMHKTEDSVVDRIRAGRTE